jgi:hypothetical protein
MAALYMSHLGDQDTSYSVQEMKAAVLKMLRDVHALQDELVSADKREASSINLCISACLPSLALASVGGVAQRTASN